MPHLDLEIHPDAPPADWESTLQALHGTMFHSPIWGDYQRSATGARPYYLRARDASGQPRGAALALLHASRRPILSALLRDLSLPAHPCVAGSDPEPAADFLRRCERFALQIGCSTLELGSFMSGRSPLDPRAAHYDETLRYEFTVDLTRDRAELWRGIKQDQRERIRKLERAGLTVDTEESREALDELKMARETTQQKRTHAGQGYSIDTEHRFYELLYDHLVRQQAGRLFLARHEGRAVAALFFAAYRGRAYSMFSGSTDEGYRLGAQSRIFWRAVEVFQDAGFTELNRGGVPASAEREGDPLHGIYQFKQRLGTERQLCRAGRKVLNPVGAWIGRSLRGARQAVRRESV